MTKVELTTLKYWADSVEASLTFIMDTGRTREYTRILYPFDNGEQYMKNCEALVKTGHMFGGTVIESRAFTTDPNKTYIAYHCTYGLTRLGVIELLKSMEEA